jgi:hypothetical protein
LTKAANRTTSGYIVSHVVDVIVKSLVFVFVFEVLFGLRHDATTVLVFGVIQKFDPAQRELKADLLLIDPGLYTETMELEV